MRANSLPAARGWYWFVGGLRLWQRSPGIIGLAAMLAFLLSGLVGSVPWLGAVLVCLMGPFVDVFLLRTCHLVSHGSKPGPRDLVAGFIKGLNVTGQGRVSGLLVLGGVTFAGLMFGKWLVTLIAGDALEQLRVASEAALNAAGSPPAGASAPVAGAAVAPVTLPLNVVAALLFNLLAISVLSIVMWIAPALTAFAGVPPVKSLFFSVVACWRNKAAFLVFGLSLACMSIPLSVVMMFGGFGQTLGIMLLFGVLMPACFASNYIGVTDIFGPLPIPGASPDAQDAA